MRARAALLRLGLGPGVVLAAAVATGCGHSVEPRSPYDASGALPVPRALGARFDLASGILLTWSATDADRMIVDVWRIERRATGTSTFVEIRELAVRDTMLVDGALEDGVRYVYRVRAVTGAGVAGVAAETAPLRADFVAPIAPTGVAAQTAPGGIALTFTPGPETDVAFFEARLAPTAPGQPPLFRQFTASPAFLGGLVSGAEYAIEVTAIDSAGRISPPSAPAVIGVAGP